MTRARNKLILVGTCKSEEDLMKYAPRPGTFLQVMRDVLKTPYDKYYISPLERTKAIQGNSAAGYVDLLPAAGTEDTAGIAAADASDSEGQAEGQQLNEVMAIYDEIHRRFTYRYPYEALLTAKSKYSVSEIRREELGKGSGPETAALPAIAGHSRKEAGATGAGRGGISAADVGTAYHRIMEFIDFAAAVRSDGSVDEAYIRKRADKLVSEGALSPDVFAKLRIENLTGFFAGNLGRRAAEAGRRGDLLKEKPFTLRTVRGGREILLQGVIDCCWREDGHMVLVDYKSSFMRPGRQHDAERERIRREYRVQVELYSEAIRKGTGLDVSEAYLYLFTTGEALRIDIDTECS